VAAGRANDAGACRRRDAGWLGSPAVLASYSKLVAELLSKGVLIYLLNIFCNATNPDNRHAAAAVFAKLIADKACRSRRGCTARTRSVQLTRPCMFSFLLEGASCTARA